MQEEGRKEGIYKEEIHSDFGWRRVNRGNVFFLRDGNIGEMFLRTDTRMGSEWVPGRNKKAGEWEWDNCPKKVRPGRGPWQPGRGWVTAQLSSVQSLSRVRLFVTPWTTAHQTSLSITNSQSLPKLMSIASVMPSNHLILCYPLLLLPSIFPSIRVFSNESVLRIRRPMYWCFN